MHSKKKKKFEKFRRNIPGLLLFMFFVMSHLFSGDAWTPCFSQRSCLTLEPLRSVLSPCSSRSVVTLQTRLEGEVQVLSLRSAPFHILCAIQRDRDLPLSPCPP